MSLSPNAYDQQFNDRINQIRSGGAPPTRPSGGGGGGGNGNGCSGAVIWIVLILLLSGLRGAFTHRSSPPPHIDIPKFEMPKIPDFPQENRELERILRELREQKRDPENPFDNPEFRKLLEDLKPDNPPPIEPIDPGRKDQ
jgi:hypothetical protein